jgi:K+-transporting ATPase ATPase C chain
MLAQFRPVIVMIGLFTLLTGFVLPLGFVGLGKIVFPFQAGGSLIERDGKVIGSALIGQSFADDKYFSGRPSALMGTDPKDSSKQVATPYDASESGASNLGPTSKALIDRVTGDIAKYNGKTVPGDMLTSSGSGLDPDISPETASLQVARVAKARGLSTDAVQALVAAKTFGPSLGFIGAAHVNVLALNLALDALKPDAAPHVVGSAAPAEHVE